MAIFYVDSTAGSNTSPYDTWAKAATSFKNVYELVSGSGGPVDGDVIRVHYQHTDPAGGTATWTFPNTARNKGILIVSVDKANDKYTKMGSNGYVGVTTGDLSIVSTNAGSRFMFDGITLRCSGASTNFVAFAPSASVIFAVLYDVDFRPAPWTSYVGGHYILEKIYQDCNSVASTTLGAIGGNAGSLIEVRKWSGANIASSRHFFHVGSAGGPQNYLAEACDLSLFDTLVENRVNNVYAAAQVRFRHCKLKSGFTVRGSNLSGTGQAHVISLESCEAGTPDRQAKGYSGVYTHGGSVVHDESVTRTAGANDGRVSYSLLMTPDSSNCSPVNPIWTDIPISKWLASGSQTVSVHFRSASNPNITDEMVWMEILSPDTAGTSSTGYAFDTTRATYGNGATISTGGSGWSGGTAYVMSKTIAPDVVGPGYVRIFCANKDMGAINVDPLPVIS